MEPGPTPARSVVKPLLIGCGLLMAVALLALVAGIAWLIRTPEGGVKMANEMDRYALKYLQEHRILNDSERLVAYYDETISMDGTEAAILTTERVIYHKDARTTSIPIRDISQVHHHSEPLTGDVIEVVSAHGDHMKIEIAPLNDGAVFLGALDDVRKRMGAAPGESPAEPPAARPTPPVNGPQ